MRGGHYLQPKSSKSATSEIVLKNSIKVSGYTVRGSNSTILPNLSVLGVYS